MAEKTVAQRRKEYIDSQVAAGSSLTRKQLGKQFDDMEMRKTADVNDVENLRRVVQQFSPAFSYLLEPGSIFGDDVAAVLAKAVREDYTSEKLVGELRTTNYFKTTEAAARQFDALLDQDKQVQIDAKKNKLRSLVGSLNLTEEQFSQVAATAARRGLDDTTATQLLYSAAFTAGTKPVMETTGVARVRQLAKSYNYDITADEIQSVLTNRPMSNGMVMSETDLVNKMRANIKGVMPQLADQIDSGLTLDDIAGNYRKYAASVLEKDPNQINMFEGPFLKAFGNKETGQLSLGEWVQTLKSDPSFGWQYTEGANQQATDIGLTLARAFGKIKGPR
jgi:hypothetical protein